MSRYEMTDRVEDDLDGFGVTFVVSIGRVLDVAAGVADARRDDAGTLADEVLHSPEAPTGEDRGLGFDGHCDASSFGAAFSKRYLYSP